MTKKQTSCKRCGNCCNEGGPALHGPDRDTVMSGKIPLSALITLRKGELALNPATGKLKAIAVELVKLKGTGKNWSCCYFDEQDKRCTIYGHRPQTCNVLKCWEPEPLLAMVEKDTLTRLDILLDNDPMKHFILEHDLLHPCPDMFALMAIIPKISLVEKRDIQHLVDEDLRFRVKVIDKFHLELNHELFYFGRPVFQLMQSLGAGLIESGAGVQLKWA